MQSVMMHNSMLRDVGMTSRTGEIKRLFFYAGLGKASPFDLLDST